jgi:protein farnesyltransferase subunit beta
MPSRVPLRTTKRGKAKDKTNMAAPQNSSQPPSSRIAELLSVQNRIQELADADADIDEEYEDVGTTLTADEEANIVYVEKMYPQIRDSLDTETSSTQERTLRDILPYLEGNPNEFSLNVFGLPKLQREKHIDYLEDSLGDYPPQFAQMDAARPWLVYWGLQGLSVLGHDISEYRER